jgi:hypothetical protein
MQRSVKRRFDSPVFVMAALAALALALVLALNRTYGEGTAGVPGRTDPAAPPAKPAAVPAKPAAAGRAELRQPIEGDATLRVRVSDAAGRAVPLTDLFLDEVSIGRSDREGRCMSRHPAGTHALSAHRKGYVRALQMVELVPGDNDVVIALPGAHEVFGEVRGDGRTVAGASVEARMITADDVSVHDVSVHDVSVHDEVSASTGATATTNADGSYALPGLAEGVYDITAAHPEFVTKVLRIRLPEQAGFLGVELEPLSGVMSGFVFGENGRPLPLVEVVAHVRLDETTSERDGCQIAEWNGATMRARTDDSGEFRIRVPKCRLELSVDLAGYTIFRTPDVIDVPAHAEPRYDIRLERGASLSVRVRDTMGAPLPALAVRASLLDPELIGDPYGSRIGARRTDGNGVAEFDGLKAGRYWVNCEVGSAEVVVPAEREITLAPNYATVSGRILDDSGTAPASPTHVVFQAHEGAAELGRGGLFGDSYALVLSAGTYDVYAFCPPDRVAVRRAVRLGAGTNSLDLSLRRGGRIVGRVVDHAGAGIAVAVRCWWQGGSDSKPRWQEIVTTADAGGDLGGLTPRFVGSAIGGFELGGVAGGERIRVEIVDATSKVVLRREELTVPWETTVDLGVLEVSPADDRG